MAETPSWLKPVGGYNFPILKQVGEIPATWDMVVSLSDFRTGSLRVSRARHAQLAHKGPQELLRGLDRMEVARGTPPRLFRDKDIAPEPAYLPRFLSPEFDRAAQKAFIEAGTFAPMAFLLLRHTGMCIGEIRQLPLNALEAMITCLESHGRDELNPTRSKQLHRFIKRMRKGGYDLKDIL